jgi:SPOC domain
MPRELSLFSHIFIYLSLLPTALTGISSDELANPKVRRARAKAEADAREAAMLTRDISPAHVAKTKEPSKKPPAIRVPSQPTISKETENAIKPSPVSGPKKPVTTLGDIVKTVRTSLPPPPPPSLAALPLAGAAPRSSRGRQISSSSGKDRFYLSLAEGKRKFSAGFYLEDDSPSPAENFLPDHLVQTGRLPIAEFCKFVAGKMESDSWETILLRLVPASEADAREYKKFYKELEAKQRIAMLSLENSSKLFLLTPKFHKDAKNFLAVNNATSTYGVLLMRR